MHASAMIFPCCFLLLVLASLPDVTSAAAADTPNTLAQSVEGARKWARSLRGSEATRRDADWDAKEEACTELCSAEVDHCITLYNCPESEAVEVDSDGGSCLLKCWQYGDTCHQHCMARGPGQPPQ